MKPPPPYHEIHRAKWMRANAKQRARLDAEFKRNRDHNGRLTPPPFDLGTIDGTRQLTRKIFPPSRSAARHVWRPQLDRGELRR